MAVKKITGPAYNQWLSELKEKIRTSRLKAALKVNAELLQLYWELGRAISEKIEQSDWGDKIIPQLAADLKAEFSDVDGFSPTNLKYMRRWYEYYSIGQQAVDLLPLPLSNTTGPEIGQHGVDQLESGKGGFPTILGLIPWGHHIQIFTKSKDVPEALYYIQQTALHNWKRSVLVYHIEEGLYYRKGKALTNFETALPKIQSEYASELMKNPYNLGFLNLSEEVTERELENAILANIKKFLLELGVGFSFYGQQFHLKVGKKDYYIDLIFYHTKLHCYFVIELKVSEFEPEHAGKLEFYITAVDKQIKLPEDNPTIGLLLCKTADKVIVEYTLKTKTKPMGVAEYKHAIPKEWKDQLPDEKVLKEELEKEIIIPAKPVDEKIDRFKEIIKKFNTVPADLKKNNDIVSKIYSEIQVPLFKLVDEKLNTVRSCFAEYNVQGLYNQRFLEWQINEHEINARRLQEENIWMLGFVIYLNTFTQGGIKAFNVSNKLEIHLDNYKYMIGPDRKVWQEKVYRQMLTKEEIEEIADRFVEMIVEEINQQAERILGI
jgi:predicted nuclease of restriction endonuclease-like (RecB) superfamily